jgi:hypothetical protein
MPARAVARPGDPGEGASEDEWRSWVRRSLGRLDEDLHAVNERVDGAEREIASSVATAGDHVERSVAELRREQHDEVIANLGLPWLGLYLAAGGVLLSTVASVAGCWPADQLALRSLPLVQLQTVVISNMLTTTVPSMSSTCTSPTCTRTVPPSDPKATIVDLTLPPTACGLMKCTPKV